jgi:hypothetical protein
LLPLLLLLLLCLHKHTNSVLPSSSSNRCNLVFCVAAALLHACVCLAACVDRFVLGVVDTSDTFSSCAAWDAAVALRLSQLL